MLNLPGLAPSSLIPVAGLLLLSGLTLHAAMVDIRAMIIPDRTSLAIFLGGMAVSFCPGGSGPLAALIAAALGGGALLLVRTVFRALRGEDGLGLGDVKFTAAAGSWTGIEGLPLALLLASVSALLFVAIRRFTDDRFNARAPLPFGPFLGLGAVSVAGLQILTGRSIAELLDLIQPGLS